MDRVHVHPHGVHRAVRMRRRGGPSHILIDVDGCLTDGGIYVDNLGTKIFKVFGPDDHDAITRAKRDIKVVLVTADKDGYDIVAERAEHIGVPVHCIPPELRSRADDHSACVYIGDGYYDSTVLRSSGFGIAPVNALPRTRRAADAVTSQRGGDRAVAQAIDFILRWLR